MNAEKTDLRKAGGWVHAGIHAVALAFVFPPLAVAALAVAHLLIDTRTPLLWWGALVQQSSNKPGPPVVVAETESTVVESTLLANLQHAVTYVPFAMGRDQAAHFLCLAVAAWLCGGR